RSTGPLASPAVPQHRPSLSCGTASRTPARVHSSTNARPAPMPPPSAAKSEPIQAGKNTASCGLLTAAADRLLPTSGLSVGTGLSGRTELSAESGLSVESGLSAGRGVWVTV